MRAGRQLIFMFVVKAWSGSGTALQSEIRPSVHVFIDLQSLCPL